MKLSDKFLDWDLAKLRIMYKSLLTNYNNLEPEDRMTLKRQHNKEIERLDNMRRECENKLSQEIRDLKNEIVTRDNMLTFLNTNLIKIEVMHNEFTEDFLSGCIGDPFHQAEAHDFNELVQVLACYSYRYDKCNQKLTYVSANFRQEEIDRVVKVKNIGMIK